MITIIVSITILYLMLIASFVIGFDRVRAFKIDDTDAKTTFSVIIPFKNEAENLSALLQSLSQLNYPDNLYEVILVNDESDDESSKIIEKFIQKRSFDVVHAERSRSSQGDIKIIQNNRITNSPKKDAINTAISKAKFDWIVTTDADCIVQKYWLDSFDSFIQKNETNFIVAPVSYHSIDTFLKRFQALDFLSLMGSTIGGFGINKPFLCNGANLAYSKDFFNELNGFEGNTNIASGDDIFLLEKGNKTATKVGSLFKVRTSNC